MELLNRKSYVVCFILAFVFIFAVQLTRFLPIKSSPFKSFAVNTAMKDGRPQREKKHQAVFKDEPLHEEVLSTEKDQCPCSVETKVPAPTQFETNMSIVINMFQQKGMKARMGLSQRHETLEPEFEAPLMKYPLTRHAVCLPDYNQSKVMLLSPSGGLSVGSAVRLRVDMYNGCGQPRLQGGDEVRAWLKSQDGQSSVAAGVRDLRNGSYLVEGVLPWPGVTLVQVSLTYAREFLQLNVELHHTVHAMRYDYETFTSGRITEAVPCLPSHPIPGYAESCDFTARNGGRPWFCGRPVDTRLTCAHRSTFANLRFTAPLPIPPQLEEYVQLIRSCCKKGNHNLRLIPNNITLLASSDCAMFTKFCQCWKMTAASKKPQSSLSHLQ